MGARGIRLRRLARILPDRLTSRVHDLGKAVRADGFIRLVPGHGPHPRRLLHLLGSLFPKRGLRRDRRPSPPTWSSRSSARATPSARWTGSSANTSRRASGSSGRRPQEADGPRLHGGQPLDPAPRGRPPRRRRRPPRFPARGSAPGSTRRAGRDGDLLDDPEAHHATHLDRGDSSIALAMVRPSWPTTSPKAKASSSSPRRGSTRRSARSSPTRKGCCRPSWSRSKTCLKFIPARTTPRRSSITSTTPGSNGRSATPCLSAMPTFSPCGTWSSTGTRPRRSTTRSIRRDLYYADLARRDGSFDDWNARKDGFHAAYFGEVRGENNKHDPINYDAIDYRPEIAVGRWPVSDPVHVTHRGREDDHLRAAVAVGPGPRPPPGGAVRGGRVGRRPRADGRVQADAPARLVGRASLLRGRRRRRRRPTSTRSSPLLNEGVGLVMHIGHGSDDSWAGLLLGGLAQAGEERRPSARDDLRRLLDRPVRHAAALRGLRRRPRHDAQGLGHGRGLQGAAAPARRLSDRRRATARAWASNCSAAVTTAPSPTSAATPAASPAGSRCSTASSAASPRRRSRAWAIAGPTPSTTTTTPSTSRRSSRTTTGIRRASSSRG